jgi:hypothetical protein
MKAIEILDYVKDIITGDRNKTHGDYQECFGLTALFWTIYLREKKKVDIDIDKEDEAMMMVLLKVARQIKGDGGTEHYFDITGYSAFAAEFCMDNKEN